MNANWLKFLAQSYSFTPWKNGSQSYSRLTGLSIFIHLDFSLRA